MNPIHTRLRAMKKKYNFIQQGIARRKGKTARNWFGNTETLFVIPVAERSFTSGKAMALAFEIPSKGGGDTDISVRIGPKDFPLLLQVMSVVDRQATIEAICGELAYQVSRKGV